MLGTYYVQIGLQVKENGSYTDSKVHGSLELSSFRWGQEAIPLQGMCISLSSVCLVRMTYHSRVCALVGQFGLSQGDIPFRVCALVYVGYVGLGRYTISGYVHGTEIGSGYHKLSIKCFVTTTPVYVQDMFINHQRLVQFGRSLLLKEGSKWVV